MLNTRIVLQVPSVYLALNRKLPDGDWSIGGADKY